LQQCQPISPLRRAARQEVDQEDPAGRASQAEAALGRDRGALRADVHLRVARVETAVVARVETAVVETAVVETAVVARVETAVVLSDQVARAVLEDHLQGDLLVAVVAQLAADAPVLGVVHPDATGMWRPLGP
jgi:hypothetical protein